MVKIPYYVWTLREFERVLRDVNAVEDAKGQPTLEHITWMAAQVEKLDRHSLADAVKAARWIGWMLLAAELNGLWDNAASRRFIRKDVEGGTDLPSVSKRA